MSHAKYILQDSVMGSSVLNKKGTLHFKLVCKSVFRVLRGACPFIGQLALENG